MTPKYTRELTNLEGTVVNIDLFKERIVEGAIFHVQVLLFLRGDFVGCVTSIGPRTVCTGRKYSIYAAFVVA